MGKAWTSFQKETVQSCPVVLSLQLPLTISLPEAQPKLAAMSNQRT